MRCTASRSTASCATSGVVIASATRIATAGRGITFMMTSLLLRTTEARRTRSQQGISVPSASPWFVIEIRLLTATSKLLKLILRLIVLRIELHGGFEVLDRSRLVALGVLHLRHRLIGLR